MRTSLRVSGLLGTCVFLMMVVSDLFLLTGLDFERPYRFWTRASQLPQAQVTFGYYLGILAVPLHSFTTAWHLSLAVRPAGAWASWAVLAGTAYSAAVLAVFHGSFAFLRSLVIAERALPHGAGLGVETSFAYSTYAAPLFRVGLVISAVTYLGVFALAMWGRTHYPRWAGAALPMTYVLVAVGLRAVASGPAGVVMGAAGWNVGGVVVMALSTAILWNRDVARS